MVNLGKWLRDILDPARLPSKVKMTANAMAAFLDVRTGCGSFTQEQLSRRIGIKNLKDVRKLINAVLGAGLIKRTRKGRKGDGGSCYMLTAPDTQSDDRIAVDDMLDFGSTGGTYPPLTEDDHEPDHGQQDDDQDVNRGYAPPTLSPATNTTELTTTTPLPPLITDQGGGGNSHSQLEPEPEPAAPPAPTAPVSAAASPEPQPAPAAPPTPVVAPAPTNPDDLRTAVEALDRIRALWGLTGKIYDPGALLRDQFADAAASGWPAEALAAHMANHRPDGKIYDPGALLRNRLERRGLPPGPGACSCDGCERWRRQADWAATAGPATATADPESDRRSEQIRQLQAAERERAEQQRRESAAAERRIEQIISGLDENTIHAVTQGAGLGRGLGRARLRIWIENGQPAPAGAAA